MDVSLQLSLQVAAGRRCGQLHSESPQLSAAVSLVRNSSLAISSCGSHNGPEPLSCNEMFIEGYVEGKLRLVLGID